MWLPYTVYVHKLTCPLCLLFNFCTKCICACLGTHHIIPYYSAYYDKTAHTEDQTKCVILFNANWKIIFCQIFIKYKNLCCGCPFDSPHRGDPNEHQQHRFLRINKQNFYLIIIKYAPYLNYHQIRTLSCLIWHKVTL